MKTGKNRNLRRLPPEFAKDLSRLPPRPKLASGVHLVSSGNEHWLHSKTQTLPLRGPLFEKMTLPLLALLDGRRTVAELCQVLPDHDPVILRFLLVRLNKAHLLDRSVPSNGRPEDLAADSGDFFECLGADLESYRERLSRSCVAIVDSGLMGKEGRALFEASGIGKTTEFPFVLKRGKPDSFWSGLIDKQEESLREKLKGHDLIIAALHVRQESLGLVLNRVCLTLGIPLLFSKMEGMKGSWVTVWPHKTACLSCLQFLRLQNHPAYREHISMEDGVLPNIWPDLEPHPIQKQILSAWISLESVRLLTHPIDAAGLGKEIEIDFRSSKTVTHPCMKLPRCPVCSLTLRIPQQEQETPLPEIWRFDRARKAFVVR